jgi:hypothetical protein
MTSSAIIKQVEDYLPMLSQKQQTLVLEMIKNFLNVGDEGKRASKKLYNKELEAAVERIEKGVSIAHKDVVAELSEW